MVDDNIFINSFWRRKVLKVTNNKNKIPTFNYLCLDEYTAMAKYHVKRYQLIVPIIYETNVHIV